MEKAAFVCKHRFQYILSSLINRSFLPYSLSVPLFPIFSCALELNSESGERQETFLEGTEHIAGDSGVQSDVPIMFQKLKADQCG